MRTAKPSDNELRREKIRALIERRGLRLAPHGRRAWRISGAGVDVVTVDLATVTALDLQPTRTEL